MEPFQILMKFGHLDQKIMQNPYMNVAEDEKQSRAPREPNLTKSEPFQIQVKLDLLDQKNDAESNGDHSRTRKIDPELSESRYCQKVSHSR